MPFLVIQLLLIVCLSTLGQQQPSRHELLVKNICDIGGQETITAIEQSEQGEAFLQTLTSNDVWMHELLDSGPVMRGEIVIRFLFQLWSEDNSLDLHDVHRSMATACALAMGMRDLDPAWMKERYNWFRDNWNANRLNIGYGDLNTFERRFIARGLQRTSWTTAKALEYLRDTIFVPRSQYAKTAWRSPYRGYNAFGDTVQGPMYYFPFRDSFDSDAEMAVKIGGVCGSLSHVGAASAIAAGIPALTMGEPGHCAYAVQTKPHTWEPAYSLSWKRGLHTSMSRNTWPSLELSQLAHCDQTQSFSAGNARRKAMWLESIGEFENANAAWREAIEINPFDESLFSEYARFGAQREMSTIWWIDLMKMIQTHLLPNHPEPGWHLLSHDVFPNMFKSGNERAQLMGFQTFLSKLDGWGSVRWNVEGALNWGWKVASNQNSKSEFLITSMQTLIDDPHVGPAYVAWAFDKSKDDAVLSSAFEQALLEESAGGGEGRNAVLKQLARTMLPPAAAEGDLDTFQRIGQKTKSLFKPRTLLSEMKIEPFEGELLSSGGALSIFKPGNRWDSPEKHWGVLEEHGGWFHTDNGETPWFEVELPKFGDLTGIILDSRNGQPGRAKGVRILVSEDGESWTQVGQTPTGHSQQRIDLSEKKPRARFVRFERDGECLHYYRVLIYGEPAS